MKNKWKKFGTGLLLGASMLALVACGSSSSKDKDGGTKDAEASKELSVSVDKGYVEYIEGIKGDFEKENDITIKVIEKDMFEQLDALTLDGPAGKAPDVMMSAYDRLGPLGQQGHLAQVKLSDDSFYNENDKKQVTVDGEFYGAPAVVETLVMFYNKDLITEAPKTFKEVEALSKDEKYNFKDESGKNVGFLAKWTDFYFAYGLISGYGGYIFGDDGTNPEDIGLNNKGAVEGIQYATDWFQNVWPKGMLDIKSAGDFVTNQFTEGKTAAIIDGPWAAKGYADADVNYGVSKIPTLDNGNPYEAFGGGKAWVISNYSTNKDMSQKFLDYVTNEKNQTTLYDDTKEIPANNKSREAAAKSDDELTKAVIEQYESAKPMPNIPEMAEVWTGGENLMFDAGSGKQTPQEAADAAVKIIKENIQQKYGE